MTALTGDELIEWLEATSAGWKKLLENHPEAMKLPCDVRETQSVAELLQHIVAVELRYAERLTGVPETPYEAILHDSAEHLYATHDRAMEQIHGIMDRGEAFWEEWISFATRSGGMMRATRRTVLVHALMHSIRHYAQLATLVRQHGIVPHWPMDYLFLAGLKG